MAVYSLAVGEGVSSLQEENDCSEYRAADMLPALHQVKFYVQAERVVTKSHIETTQNYVSKNRLL